MKQFFQRIKVWYAARSLTNRKKECRHGSSVSSGRMGWAALDVQISQEVWLRNNGLK